LFSEDADVEVDESLFQDMDALDIDDDNDLDIDNSDVTLFSYVGVVYLYSVNLTAMLI
jgi:hypothetical protein